jgi:cysteine-rich repeat protein
VSINCDDDDACTDDSCDSGAGCQNAVINCDDENACTVDSCNSESGCHNAVITCDDENACTENTCDPQFGCRFPGGCDDDDACTVDTCGQTGCEHTALSCDDQDACTTDTCDGQGGCTHARVASCAGAPELDDFQCYKSQRPSVGLRGVSVVDQFGASTVAIKRARRLCAPASTAGNDPEAVDAAGHLTTYSIRQTTPRFVGEKSVKVVNALGEITVDLIRPERLLVPTAKSLTSPPGPLTEDLDHFKCYRVRGAPFRKKGITIETQFGPTTVDIKRPRYLCAPANKNGETPNAETHVPHLMCYDVRARTQRSANVFTTNQFGADHYDVVGLRELCVASFQNPGTCGNGSVDAPGETCDPPGAVCASDGRVCGASCTCPAPACGDGIVNQASEQCDDGNTVSGDGCSATCQTETPTVCGDNVRQGIEQCDGTDDANCTGACASCACLVSSLNCPPGWTIVDTTLCVLRCGTSNSCPEPFTCDESLGFCREPCGTAPTCGGGCPGVLSCLTPDCYCGGLD